MSFIAAVFRSTFRVLPRPALWLPSMVVSVIADAIVQSLHWPASPQDPPPTAAAITTMTLVLLGRAWFVLTLTMMALASLRGERVGFFRQWVHVVRALEIALVSLVLLVPIALGTVALILPGIYLLTMWSQVAVVIADDEARFFKAPNWSASLTDGYRMEIAAIWGSVYVVSAILPLIASPGTWRTAQWGWSALTNTFGIAMAAAMYFELSGRAPWQPELRRVGVSSTSGVSRWTVARDSR